MGGGGSSSTGESWSRTNPGFMGELSTILDRNLKGQTGFGKQDAINDVQGVIQQNAINTMQEALPKIASGERLAGAYGSTTRTMMNNDLQARIAGQMAATQLQAIQDYAAIDSDKIRAFASATQAGTSTASEHFESSQSRNASPWASALGGLGRTVAGGAADLIAGDPDKKDMSKVASISGWTPQGFANGGVVPARKDQSTEEEYIEKLGLDAVANSYLVDRDREKKLKYQQQAEIKSTKKSGGDDEGEELFRLIGIV